MHLEEDIDEWGTHEISCKKLPSIPFSFVCELAPRGELPMILDNDNDDMNFGIG